MKVFTYQCGRKFSDSDIPCFLSNKEQLKTIKVLKARNNDAINSSLK